MLMLEWYVEIAGILLAVLIYYAYFFKFNWIRNLRTENRRTGGVYAGPKNRKVGKLPPVYPNGWFVLLESLQLKKGQVKHVSALGENFAVFRTEKGVVNILDAYCPHLGANMAEGGRVKGDCLECPFHSWTFRGADGFCDSVPYAEKVPHIARVRTWKCCEVNNLIFVWYHAESIEPDWQPQPQPCISNGTWRFQGRNEFFISCHIQEIPENGADYAHLNVLHSPSMFLTNLLKPWLARHSWTNAMWQPHCSYSDTDAEMDPEAEAASSAEMRVKFNGTSIHPMSNGNHYPATENGFAKREKHKAGMQMRHALILLERFTLFTFDVNVELTGPGYVELILESMFGRICILQTVTPVEPLLQRVTHLIYSPPLLAPYAKMIFLGECLMFARDVAIWNYKQFQRQPILVREDRAIVAYRRWYSQFYSAQSPTYQNATKSLQW